jgi:hypothetical protein
MVEKFYSNKNKIEEEDAKDLSKKCITHQVIGSKELNDL